MSQQNRGPVSVRAQFGPSYNVGLNIPRPLTDLDRQSMTLALARAFEPKQVVGFQKVRLGRHCDGGYVHVDDFSGVGAAISVGIADDASWDLDVVSRNIPVYQLDDSIDQAPISHPLMTFRRQRIAETDGPDAVSLDTLARQLLADCDRAILKIDIEGNEWPVFQAAAPETLAKFSQIVCEFHGFKNAGEPAWSERALGALGKLRSVFEVVHVHGNNALPFVIVGNVVLPSLLEVTFANRAYYRFAETTQVFPTALDRPNVPGWPDLWLGCFKF
jgi:Methyltransferase FkbM domain